MKIGTPNYLKMYPLIFVACSNCSTKGKVSVESLCRAGGARAVPIPRRLGFGGSNRRQISMWPLGGRHICCIRAHTIQHKLPPIWTGSAAEKNLQSAVARSSRRPLHCLGTPLRLPVVVEQQSYSVHHDSSALRC